MLAGLEALKMEAGYFSETPSNSAKTKDNNVIILYLFTLLRYVAKTSNACYLKKYTENLLGSLHFPLVLFFCNFI
jgi:hypothetical protein